MPSSPRERHDHASRQSFNTTIASFARDAELGACSAYQLWTTRGWGFREAEQDRALPASGGQGHTALLGNIFTVLLANYDDDGAFPGRIRVAVPRVAVGQETVTALALAVHEPATNALKYGALSVPAGTLDISGTMDDATIVL